MVWKKNNHERRTYVPHLEDPDEPNKFKGVLWNLEDGASPWNRQQQVIKWSGLLNKFNYEIWSLIARQAARVRY